MAALRSFCPKAIVEVGSFSPKGAASSYAPITPQFCSFPNGKKGSEFGFLKFAHNKGIRSLHVVQSNAAATQVELENVMLQEQEQQKSAEQAKIIHIRFQLTRECVFGENFFLVGDDPILGSWDPSKALPMTWSEGHIWTMEQEIPAGTRIQFKCILKKKDGEIDWQPGNDRIFHTWESMNRVTVCVDWDNDKFQKLIENAEEEEPKESEVEENQTTNEMMMKQPLDEQNMKQITANNISSLMKDPISIVEENVGSSNGNVKSANITTPGNNDAQMQGSGMAAPAMNQERQFVKNNNQSVIC